MYNFITRQLNRFEKPTVTAILSILVIVSMSSIAIYVPINKVINSVLIKGWLPIVITALITLIILLLLVILVLAASRHELLQKTKLKLDTGIFYDNDFLPYCPSCQSPLVKSIELTAGVKILNTLLCAGCNQHFYPKKIMSESFKNSPLYIPLDP